MDIITYEFNDEIYVPTVLKDTLASNYCFFDIETTGFNRKYDSIILIGALIVSGSQVTVKQYFADTLKEEEDILLAFFKDTITTNNFITYNGDAFDIPFINTKADLLDINYRIDSSNSIDLLKVVRKNKSMLNLDNHKLKTVEKFLGIFREDKISGKESVDIYNRYLKSKDEKLKQIVLKHNYDDIYHLPKLLSIYDLIEEIDKLSLNFIFNNQNVSYDTYLSNVDVKKDRLLIVGNTEKLNLADQVYYGENYTFKWTPKLGVLELYVQLQGGLLSDGKQCVYLNKDDFSFSLDIIDESPYNVPISILIVKEDKTLIMENIKEIVKVLIQEISSKLST